MRSVGSVFASPEPGQISIGPRFGDRTPSRSVGIILPSIVSVQRNGSRFYDFFPSVFPVTSSNTRGTGRVPGQVFGRDSDRSQHLENPIYRVPGRSFALTESVGLHLKTEPIRSVLKIAEIGSGISRPGFASLKPGLGPTDYHHCS